MWANIYFNITILRAPCGMKKQQQLITLKNWFSKAYKDNNSIPFFISSYAGGNHNYHPETQPCAIYLPLFCSCKFVPFMDIAEKLLLFDDKVNTRVWS